MIDSPNRNTCNIYLSISHTISFHLFIQQKFQNCSKKFDNIDYTLLKLGTTTDYNNLRKKAIWCVLGLIVIVILITYFEALLLKDKHDDDITTIMLFFFTRDYCFHINLIGDLINASILKLVYLFTYIYNYIFIIL